MFYLIADTHFFHKNIIEYCNRPFEDTETMNNYIIEKWNSIVKEDDIVLHLGDVGFGMVEMLSPIIHSLNGHKFLIRGNHDRKRGVNSWENMGFEKVFKGKKVKFEEFLENLDFLKNVNFETLQPQRFAGSIYLIKLRFYRKRKLYFLTNQFNVNQMNLTFTDTFTMYH